MCFLPDFTCKIADFDTARFTGEETVPESPSTLEGLLPYASPEIVQAAELRRKLRFHASCDIWTAGIIACELLTGQPIHRGPGRNRIFCRKTLLRCIAEHRVHDRCRYRQRAPSRDRLGRQTNSGFSPNGSSNGPVVFGRRATAEGFYTDWSNVWNRSDAGFNTRMMRRPSSLLRHGPTQFCCT